MKTPVIWVSAIIMISQAGCVITKTESTKTGLFGDNSAAMFEAYGKVKVGQTIAEVESPEIGFKFDAPNIDRSEGINAIKTLFGPAALERALQSSLMESTKADQKVDDVLKALNPYLLYRVPFKRVTTKRDRFYISRQDTFRNGEALLIYFLFKDGKLVYITHDYQKINEKETEKAFLKGLFDLFGGAGGAYEEYRDYKDRKND